MKKILLAFLAVASLSSLAAEYHSLETKVFCYMSADMQSVNMNKVNLENNLSFQIKLKERLKGKKVVKREVEISEDSPLEIDSIKHISRLAIVRHTIHTNKRTTIPAITKNPGVKLRFKKLNRSELFKILKQMDRSVEVEPRKGLSSHKLKLIKAKSFDTNYGAYLKLASYDQGYDEFKEQIHYDIDEYDGFSYHVKVSCITAKD